MRVLFFGTPNFAAVVLEAFLRDDFFEIVGLVTQKDKPFGRKKELKIPATKELLLKFLAGGAAQDSTVSQDSPRKDSPKNLDSARSGGDSPQNPPQDSPKTSRENPPIPIFQDFEDFGFVNALKPEIIVVVAYGKIIPKGIVSRYFCLNLHGSILPKLRGASPIQQMILEDLDFLGLSVIKMDEKLDNGAILSLRYLKNSRESFEKTANLLAQNGANLLLKTLKNLAQIAPLPQENADASYCKKIRKNDGELDLKSAKETRAKALAYATWPHIFLPNGTKFFGVEIFEPSAPHKRGEILAIGAEAAGANLAGSDSGLDLGSDSAGAVDSTGSRADLTADLAEKNFVVIGCQKGSIRVREIQESGKNRLDAAVFLRGKRLGVGNFIFDF